MRTATLVFCMFLQMILPDLGTSTILDSWQEEEKRSDGSQPPLPSTAAMCLLLRCPGLSDAKLRSCYHRKCTDGSTSDSSSSSLTQDSALGRGKSSSATQEEEAACVQGKCSSLQGALLKACALYKCGSLMTPQMVERRGGIRGLWPDEFETRMVERGMWPDEYETRDVGEEERRSSSRHSNGDNKLSVAAQANRALVRRARSEGALTDPEEIERAKNVKKSVQKRWSTRICMESHCKNAHSKVQYFMCGQMHCHR